MFNAVVLGLLNPVFAATQNTIAKINLVKSDDDLPIVFARLFYVVPVLLGFLCWTGMPTKIDTRFWLWMVVLAVFEVPSQWFYHQAMKKEQNSLVLPIESLLLLPLLATFLFSGKWSWLGVSGGIIVLVGVYTLQCSRHGFSWTNLLLPIKSIYTYKPSRHMLYTILFWSVTTPLQGVTVELLGEKDVITLADAAFMGVIYLSFCSILTIFWRVLEGKSIKTLVFPHNVKKLAPIGIFAGFGSICQYTTVALIGAYYMSALKKTILIWTLLVDKYILKEKDITTMQVVSNGIIFIGAVMVCISVLVVKGGMKSLSIAG